jgi:hypothetical protein
MTPADERGLCGLQFGYRVKISHPTKSLPQEYVPIARVAMQLYRASCAARPAKGHRGK